MLRILATLSLWSVLLPYVVTIPTQSDIQPNALVLSAVFISAFIVMHGFRVQVSYVMLVFFTVFLYAVTVPAITESISLRGVVPYASVVVFSFAGFLMVRNNLFNPNIVRYATWLWMFFGLGQVFISPQFGTFLLMRSSTSTSRGVVSLAAEPSFYGIMCLFMMVVIDALLSNGVMAEKTAKKYKLLLIFQMVFLAQSFTAVFLYLIYLASGVLVTISLKRLIKTASYTAIALSLLLFLMEKYNIGGSRLNFLLNTLFSNPWLLVSVDVSASQRAADIYMALYGFYDSLPMAFGHGNTAFRDFVNGHMSMLPKVIPQKMDDRIMSGYGAALFELGYIGLLIPVLTVTSFWRGQTARMKGIGLFLGISMFSAISLSFPLFSFLVGMSEAFRAKHAGRMQHKAAAAES